LRAFQSLSCASQNLSWVWKCDDRVLYRN